MKPLTDRDREALLTAGEFCFDEILEDIELDRLDEVEYDVEKLRASEVKAWRELRRSETKNKLRRWRLAVVCILLACVVTVVLGKPTVAYQKLWNSFFTKEDGVAISITSSSTALVPDSWSGCYLPLEIPKEYQIEFAEALELSQSILYCNGEDGYIAFTVLLGDYGMNIDVEDCIVEEVWVDKTAGQLLSKYQDSVCIDRTLYWVCDDVFFAITSNDLNKKALVSMAESVMLAE